MKDEEELFGYRDEVHESVFVMGDLMRNLHKCMVWLLAADELKDWCATMPNKGIECFSKDFFDTCDDENVRFLSGLYGQVVKTHDALCLVNEIKVCKPDDDCLHEAHSGCEDCETEEEDEVEIDADVLEDAENPMSYSDVLHGVGGYLLEMVDDLRLTCSRIMLAAGKVVDAGYFKREHFDSYEIARYGDPNVVLIYHLQQRMEAAFCYLGHRNGLEWGEDYELGDERWG